MSSATRAMTAMTGAIVGLMGIEHGAGEILQGNIPPDGMMILSWPEAEFFSILAGEPAMTVVPNLLVSGILASLSSLVFLVLSTRFAAGRYVGPLLGLLSIVMLLVGAGFGPPLIGVILSVSVTLIQASLARQGRRPTAGILHFSGKAWRWQLGFCAGAWLLLFPGTCILAFYFGMDNPTVVYWIILTAFGSLLLALFSGYAHDVCGRRSARETHRPEDQPQPQPGW